MSTSVALRCAASKGGRSGWVIAEAVAILTDWFAEWF